MLALDTDSTPNLALSLGIDKGDVKDIIPIARNENLILDRTGSRPGSGWGKIFRLNPKVDDLIDRYGVKVNDNLKLVVVGSIDTSKQGCLCPAVALAKRLIKYTLKSDDRYVIVDSEAGAEVFGRGLAEYFDYMLIVSEPTYKSLSISKEMIRLSEELDVRNIVVIINKVVDESLSLELYHKVIEDEAPHHLIRFDNNLQELEYKGIGLDKLSANSEVYTDVSKLIQRFMGV